MSTSTKKAYSGKFTSTALSTGGQFHGGDRTQPLVVDKSNAQRQLKKPVGSAGQGSLDTFNMFKPLIEHQSPGRKLSDPKATLHSDPFAAERSHYQAPIKRLLDHPHKEREAGHRKHTSPKVKDGQYKEQIITANGLVMKGGGKFVHQDRHIGCTTFDKETKSVDLSQSNRYKNAAAARKEEGNPITSKNASGALKDATPYHRGIKKSGNAPDPSASLEGVLRMSDPKPARAYDYRPPWGTANTPRSAAPASGVFHSGHTTRNAPWATSMPPSANTSVPQTPKTDGPSPVAVTVQ